MVRARLARTAWAAILLIAYPAAAAGQAEEPVEVNEVRTGFAERVDAMIAHGRWAELFALYRSCLERPDERNQVVPIEGGGGWVGVTRWLNERFAGGRLPAEAWEFYRARYDQDALWEMARYREDGDEGHLVTIVERHLFSSVGDEAALELANRAMDRGRWADAANWLDRLLRWYPDPSVAVELVAARLALALARCGNAATLRELESLLSERGISGIVRVGGEAVPVRDLVARWAAELEAAASGGGDPGTPVAAERPILGSDVLLYGPIRFERYDRFEPWKVEGAPQMRGGRLQVHSALGGERVTPLEPVAVPAFARWGRRSAVVALRMAMAQPGRGGMRQEDEPDRIVALDPASGRVYWTHDLRAVAEVVRRTAPGPIFISPPGGSPEPPRAGAVIDGDELFVLAPTRVRAPPEQGVVYDPRWAVPELGRIVCVRIHESGRIVRRVLWDTDVFYDRVAPTQVRWTACHPIVVSGERVFVPVSALEGSVESFVVCLDRATGRPLWKTFLAARSALGAQFGRTQMPRQTYTTLAYEGGVLYAATNVGVVAALSPVDGSILWMTPYPSGQVPAGRRSSPPVVMGGRVWVLPADSPALLAFDAQKGARRPVAQPTGRLRGYWSRQALRLVGRVGDMLVIAGTGTSESDAMICYWPSARGDEAEVRWLVDSWYDERYEPAIHEGHLYMPYRRGDRTGMRIYRVEQARLVAEGAPWDPVARPEGQLLAAGEYLVTVGEAVHIFVTSQGLDRIYGPWIAEPTPDVDKLFEYARLKRRAGAVLESGRPFERFLELAGDRPEYRARVPEARLGVYEAAMAECASAHPEDDRRRLAALERAQRFAPDAASRARVARELAVVHIRADRRHEAIKAFQQAVLYGGKDLWERVGERYEPLWRHYRRVVEEWLQSDPALLEWLESRVELELGPNGGDDPERLVALLRQYPNSRRLRGELLRVVGQLLLDGRLDEAGGLARVLEECDERLVDPALRRWWIEALISAGEQEAASFELERLAAVFGDEPAGDGEGVSIREWVAARLAQIEAGRAAAEPRRELSRRCRILPLPPGGVPHPSMLIEFVPEPLRPGGLVPAAFPPDVELIAQGSVVELRRLADGSVVWSLARPTPQLPLAFTYAGGLRLVDDGRRVLRIDGREVQPSSLMKFVAGLEADRDVAIELDGGVFRTVRTVVSPPNTRPRLVGAALDGRDALVVAWEDCVARVDWRDGRVLWMRPIGRDGVGFAAVAAAGGLFFVLETPYISGQRVDPYGVLGGARAEAPAVRVSAWLAATGEPLWWRDVTAGAERFYGGSLFVDPATRVVGVIDEDPRPNAPEGRVRVAAFAARDGAVLGAWSSPVVWSAWEVDVAAGLVYAVPDGRSLVAVSLGYGRMGKGWSSRMALPPEMVGGIRIALAPGGVVLFSDVGRGWVASASPGGLQVVRHLELPGRRFPPQPAWTNPAVTADGTVLVYNLDPQGRALVSGLEPGVGRGPTPHWLLPWRNGGEMVLQADIPGLVVAAGVEEQGRRERVRDSRNGRLSTMRLDGWRLVEPQLSDVQVIRTQAGALGRPAVWVWRGRLFVVRTGPEGGLNVYE